jgi:biotin carboxyl carrier protein
MALEEIEALAVAMAADGRTSATLEEAGLRVTLRRQAATALAKGAPPHILRAPWFGHFRRVHPLRSEAESSTGARIDRGGLVGYVEIDARLYPVASDRAGRVAEMLAEDGALVGYGEAIVRIA